MKVPISSIRVKRRIRKDNGDIAALAASMLRYGQLHPLVITDTYVLVSGYRRLLAAQSLGWNTIEAIIIDKTSKLELYELELDENLYRKALTEDELHDAFIHLDKLRNPNWFIKVWNTIISFFKNLFKRQQN